MGAQKCQQVTPCMGVWIETSITFRSNKESRVTPCMGVWIETLEDSSKFKSRPVTPCMGVWIETSLAQFIKCCARSHPVWVCGLKQTADEAYRSVLGHTLYGCVD